VLHHRRLSFAALVRLGLMLLVIGGSLLAHSAAEGQTTGQTQAEPLVEGSKRTSTDQEATARPPAKPAAAFDWWDLLKVVGGAALGILIKAIFDLFALRKASERKIVETMTTKLHEYAEKYYMPCVNQAARAKRNIAAYTVAPPQMPDPESALRALHALALLHSKINKGKREIGGVFLTTRTGEAIVSALEGEITSQVTKSGLTIEDVLEIVALVEPTPGPTGDQDGMETRDVSFLAFRAKAGADATKQLCERWRAWLGGKGKDVTDLVRILSCYSEILLYEVNRTYEAWYGEKEALSMGRDEYVLMLRMAREHTPVGRARTRYIKRALQGCTEATLRRELLQQARG
jgi:hypothetical protein